MQTFWEYLGSFSAMRANPWRQIVAKFAGLLNIWKQVFDEEELDAFIHATRNVLQQYFQMEREGRSTSEDTDELARLVDKALMRSKPDSNPELVERLGEIKRLFQRFGLLKGRRLAKYSL